MLRQRVDMMTETWAKNGAISPKSLNEGQALDTVQQLSHQDRSPGKNLRR